VTGEGGTVVVRSGALSVVMRVYVLGERWTSARRTGVVMIESCLVSDALLTSGRV
jgi:hypothetical protein